MFLSRFTGAHSSVLACSAHIQTILLPLRRRSRENRTEELNAHRRAVHGRLEEILPGGDVLVA